MTDKITDLKNRIYDKRLANFFFSVLTKDAEIKLENGNKAKGILYALDPERGGVIFNKYVESNLDNSIVEELDKKLLVPEEILYFVVNNIEAPPVLKKETSKGKGKNFNKGAFQTDGEISKKKKGLEKDLVKWDFEADSHQSNLLLEDTKLRGKDGWDQFKVNNEKFGIDFTYHDDHYTTKLDINSVDENLRKKAERIEAELRASGSIIESRHIQEERGLIELAENDDEEAHYSAVLGSGAYNQDGKKKVFDNTARDKKSAEDQRMINSARGLEKVPQTTDVKSSQGPPRKGFVNNKLNSPDLSVTKMLSGSSQSEEKETNTNEFPVASSTETIPKSSEKEKQEENKTSQVKSPQTLLPQTEDTIEKTILSQANKKIPHAPGLEKEIAQTQTQDSSSTEKAAQVQVSVQNKPAQSEQPKPQPTQQGQTHQALKQEQAHPEKQNQVPVEGKAQAQAQGELKNPQGQQQQVQPSQIGQAHSAQHPGEGHQKAAAQEAAQQSAFQQQGTAPKSPEKKQVEQAQQAAKQSPLKKEEIISQAAKPQPTVNLERESSGDKQKKDNEATNQPAEKKDEKTSGSQGVPQKDEQHKNINAPISNKISGEEGNKESQNEAVANTVNPEAVAPKPENVLKKKLEMKKIKIASQEFQLQKNDPSNDELQKKTLGLGQKTEANPSLKTSASKESDEKHLKLTAAKFDPSDSLGGYKTKNAEEGAQKQPFKTALQENFENNPSNAATEGKNEWPLEKKKLKMPTGSANQTAIQPQNKFSSNPSPNNFVNKSPNFRQINSPPVQPQQFYHQPQGGGFIQTQMFMSEPPIIGNMPMYPYPTYPPAGMIMPNPYPQPFQGVGPMIPQNKGGQYK